MTSGAFGGEFSVEIVPTELRGTRPLTPTTTATVVPPTVTTAPSAPPNVPTPSGWALALLGLCLATLGFVLTRSGLR